MFFHWTADGIHIFLILQRMRYTRTPHMHRKSTDRPSIFIISGHEALGKENIKQNL